ncbi:MAG: hypothetical protein J2P36_20630, partial [Ktedonobacteraceae bacterium]|nr:hypothetical protein [Ktedonobacteraceae bacterium]
AASDNLSVHHIGVPFADGRPGDHRNKHDLRRENLIALCFTCHDRLEQIGSIRKTMKRRRQKRAAQLAAHRALGIGTGLVPYDASMSMGPLRQHVGMSTASL